MYRYILSLNLVCFLACCGGAAGGGGTATVEPTEKVDVARSSLIVPGVSAAGVALGDWITTVDSLLGPHEQDAEAENKDHFDYRRYKEMTISYSNKKVVGILLNRLSKDSLAKPPFLANGLKLGSTKAEVEAIYGPAAEGWNSRHRLEDFDKQWLTALDKGVSFHFGEEGVVNVIGVFVPQKTGAMEVVPSESIGGARLGITRSELHESFGTPYADPTSRELYYPCLGTELDDSGIVTRLHTQQHSWCGTYTTTKGIGLGATVAEFNAAHGSDKGIKIYPETGPDAPIVQFSVTHP